MSFHVIEADGYRLVCDLENGGCIRSLTWNDQDVLRPAGEGDVDPLSMGSFPLVPFSNRLGQDVPGPDGVLRLPRYLDFCEHAIHGFGWKRRWRLLEKTSNAISFELTDDTSPWPAPYRAVQQIVIADGAVSIGIAIEPLGEGGLPAGIGLHPYFPRGDAQLAINVAGKWDKGADSLPAKVGENPLFGEGHSEVGSLRLDHSFAGWDGEARLTWPSRGLSVQLSACETLRDLVIYVPDDDYICIEPVSHLTNAMFGGSEELGHGWRVLEPGQTLKGSFEIKASALP